MTQLKLAALFPATFNLNADVANLRVLAKRLSISGLTVSTENVSSDFSVNPSDLDFLVIGSPSSSNLLGVADMLKPLRTFVSAAIDNGTTILAVNGGLHLLGEITGTAGEKLPGLGLLPIQTRIGGKRMVTIGAEVELGEYSIFGVENHDATVRIPDNAELGRVVHGHGNNHSGVDGFRSGNIWGTHLHGPVFALNPKFADEVATQVASHRGQSYATNAEHSELDRLSEIAAKHLVERRGK